MFSNKWFELGCKGPGVEIWRMAMAVYWVDMNGWYQKEIGIDLNILELN